jgi:16S rRNA (adenine(1408)-N(1))-methyltransferase
VRAAVEGLPPELSGTADRVTVVLPWGSLLAALALPAPAVLGGIRGVCQPGAALTLVLGIDSARDRTEALRLGLPSLDEAYLAGPLAARYAAAGFATLSVCALTADRLAQWPSTWAKRLGHGYTRTVFQIEARAVG